MHNWVPQRPDFKNALRVVKMVLNTQCFLCLWLSIRFHAKIINQNTKKKALIYNVGSRHEKSPKLAEKNGSLNRELLGIWHILDGSWWILMSRQSYGRPKLTLVSKKNYTKLQCCKKRDTVAIFKVSLPQQISVGSWPMRRRWFIVEPIFWK